MIPFFESREFGSTAVTAINEAVVNKRVENIITAPENEWRSEIQAGPDGEIKLSQAVAYVNIGGVSLLLDCDYDDAGPESRYQAPVYKRFPGMSKGLELIGVEPESITHVLLSHSHPDHIMGATIIRDGRRIPRFPNATYYIGRADWEGNPARDRPGSLLQEHLGAIDQARQLELVDDGAEIVPGVTMIWTGGETPGHCVVRITSGGKSFVFLGDLIHHSVQCRHPNWVMEGPTSEGRVRDTGELRTARDRVFAAAAADESLLLASHVPGFGRVRKTSEGSEWVPA